MKIYICQNLNSKKFSRIIFRIPRAERSQKLQFHKTWTRAEPKAPISLKWEPSQAKPALRVWLEPEPSSSCSTLSDEKDENTHLVFLVWGVEGDLIDTVDEGVAVEVACYFLVAAVASPGAGRHVLVIGVRRHLVHQVGQLLCREGRQQILDIDFILDREICYY